MYYTAIMFTKKHFFNLSHPFLPNWRRWFWSTCGGRQEWWNENSANWHIMKLKMLKVGRSIFSLFIFVSLAHCSKRGSWSKTWLAESPIIYACCLPCLSCPQFQKKHRCDICLEFHSCDNCLHLSSHISRAKSTARINGIYYPMI